MGRKLDCGDDVGGRVGELNLVCFFSTLAWPMGKRLTCGHFVLEKSEHRVDEIVASKGRRALFVNDSLKRLEEFRNLILSLGIGICTDLHL